MAKRRKTTRRKTTSRRRSRVSGLGKIDFMNLIAVAGGLIGSKFIGNMLPDTIDKNIVAGGKVAVGAALPMLVKDAKTKQLLSGVGAGMAAGGAVDLLTNFGILSGVDVWGGVDNLNTNFQPPIVETSVLGGMDDLSIINGLDDLSVVNG